MVKYSIYLLIAALLCSMSLAHQKTRKNQERSSSAVITKDTGEQKGHSFRNNKDNNRSFRPASHWSMSKRSKQNRHFKTKFNKNNRNEAPYFSCGVGPNSISRINGPNHRIINGTNADKNSWPSMVALFIEGRFWCGGSLLDNNYVLTAAHCVENYRFTTNTSGLMVSLGMHAGGPDYDPQVTREISQVIAHYMYDNRTFYNDIAILKMANPVKFNHSISPVCLPENSRNQFSNVNVTIIGWGVSDINEGSTPPVLQQFTQETMSIADCREHFYQPAMVADKMLCIKNYGQDSCQGDSGGPVFYREGSRWLQIGITSWGIGCADPTYPAIYVRVPSYVNWIRKNTNQKQRRA